VWNAYHFAKEGVLTYGQAMEAQGRTGPMSLREFQVIMAIQDHLNRREEYYA
jgi:hypothetical protein